jgi:hypothetical protein
VNSMFGRAVSVTFLAIAPLQGQQQDTAVLRGRLLERGSGQAVPGQMVSVAGDLHHAWATTDSSGAFLLGPMSADSVALIVTCRTSRRPWGRTLGPFLHARSGAGVVQVEIPPGACEEPPEVAVEGVWQGHFSSGFEESSFIPCGGLPDLSDTAYGVVNSGVWLDFEKGARDFDWPTVPIIRGTTRYFVTLRGTRHGPGGYGHLGFSVFRISVDSILAASAPGPGDCGIHDARLSNQEFLLQGRRQTPGPLGLHLAARGQHHAPAVEFQSR